MHITSNNYINIQSFMVTDLKLKGNELLAYAIIYGFSQGNQGKFTGRNKYIAEWLNCSVKTVSSILKSLTEKGLINKIVNYPYDDCKEVTVNHYTANVIPLEKNTEGVGNNYIGGQEDFTQGGRKILHTHIDNNNIYNTNIDNNNIYNTTNEENSEVESSTISKKETVAKATTSKFKSKYGLSFTSDDTEQGDKLLDDYLQAFNTQDKERISSLLIEFIKLRKDKRKPIITLRMLKGIVNNLKALNSPTTADYVVKKIELTLDRGWLDVKEYESNGYNVNKHVDTRPKADDNDYSADVDVIFKRK